MSIIFLSGVALALVILQLIENSLKDLSLCLLRRQDSPIRFTFVTTLSKLLVLSRVLFDGDSEKR